MKYLNFLVLLSLFGCSGGEVKRTLNDQGYQTSGVEQFFLPELPSWSNFSASGMCFKSASFSYFNFKKLSDAYQLKYSEMIELQAQYNARTEIYFRSAAVKFLKPVEEASFFSNTLEQVRGGVKTMKIPRVNEMDIIWLDSYVMENKTADLVKMAKSGKFDERLPVLFSSCMSRQVMQQWLVENNLEEAGFYTIGAEWLSSFNAEGKEIPALQIDVAKLFGPGIKFHFISSGPHLKLPELVNLE